MSVTSGFFNSLNHDRRYNAQQMSSIFDGVINDGVFANIGVAFKVTAAGGVTVNIGEGKAWFNSAWVQNDTVLPLTFEASEVVLDRIDAIVIDVDHNESVRSGDIKIVKGTPSSSPKRPAMASDKKHKQAPLVYIYRKAGSTEITQADITNMIGTSECPYITGILQVQDIDNIVAQWNAQWDEWYAAKVAKANSDVSQLNAQLNEWYTSKVTETNSDVSEILAEMQAEFDSWFDDFKSVLDDDVASSLAAKVADLMAKFDTLAKEGAVYDEIEDSDFNEILGSDGTPIQGKTALAGSSNGQGEANEIGAVAVDGSTLMTGDLNMNSNRVYNVAEPKEPDDAATAKYVDTAISKSNPPINLLANSNLTDPVNSTGLGSYVNNNTSQIGAVDKFKFNYGTVDVNDGFVTFTTAAVDQYKRFGQGTSHTLKAGKTYTLAIYAHVTSVSGSVYLRPKTSADAAVSGATGQALFKTADYQWIMYSFTPSSDIPNVGVEILSYKAASNTIDISMKYWCLYEGSYTIDTLPAYKPNSKTVEELDCGLISGDVTVNGDLTANRATVEELDCGLISGDVTVNGDLTANATTVRSLTANEVMARNNQATGGMFVGSDSRLVLYERMNSSSYYEGYKLPAIASSLSATKVYEILTTKTFTITSGNGTADSANVSKNNKLKYSKYGRVVLVDFELEFGSNCAASYTWYQAGTGLPTATVSSRNICLLHNISNGAQSMVIAEVTSSGALRIQTRTAGLNGGAVFGSVIYISAS